MSCFHYEQYEKEQLTEKAFHEHFKSCSICQEISRQDEILLMQAKKLRQPVNAPHLWEKIAKEINANQKPSRPLPLIFSGFSLKIAASVLLMVLLASYFLLFNPSQSSGLLTEQALERVKQLEEAYLDSINQLEQVVRPKMKLVNVELALKYRDRLEIIDDQIKLCKEELSLNPTNSHIRRYLLAALQDKKDTLMEIQKVSLVTEEYNNILN